MRLLSNADVRFGDGDTCPLLQPVVLGQTEFGTVDGDKRVASLHGIAQMGMDGCLARPVTQSQLLAQIVSLRARLPAAGAAIAAPQDLGAVLMPR